jgi:hypothetical protein
LAVNRHLSGSLSRRMVVRLYLTIHHGTFRLASGGYATDFAVNLSPFDYGCQPAPLRG